MLCLGFMEFLKLFSQTFYPVAPIIILSWVSWRSLECLKKPFCQLFSAYVIIFFKNCNLWRHLRVPMSWKRSRMTFMEIWQVVVFWCGKKSSEKNALGNLPFKWSEFLKFFGLWVKKVRWSHQNRPLRVQKNFLGNFIFTTIWLY